jgi:hypothetical protein
MEHWQARGGAVSGNSQKISIGVCCAARAGVIARSALLPRGPLCSSRTMAGSESLDGLQVAELLTQLTNNI